MGILDLIIEENKHQNNDDEDDEFGEDVRDEDDDIDKLVGSQCPYCEIGVMKIRYSKFGRFLGCSNFPRCAYKINEKYDNDIGTAGYKRVPGCKR